MTKCMNCGGRAGSGHSVMRLVIRDGLLDAEEVFFCGPSLPEGTPPQHERPRAHMFSFMFALVVAGLFLIAVVVAALIVRVIRMVIS